MLPGLNLTVVGLLHASPESPRVGRTTPHTAWLPLRFVAGTHDEDSHWGSKTGGDLLV